MVMINNIPKREIVQASKKNYANKLGMSLQLSADAPHQSYRLHDDTFFVL